MKPLVAISVDRRGRTTKWRVMPEHEHGGGFTLQWYSEVSKRWEFEIDPSVNDFKPVKVFKTLASARAALRSLPLAQRPK